MNKIKYNVKIRLLLNQKEALERKISDYEWGIKGFKQELEILNLIIEDYSESKCHCCNGIGSISISYAPDDVRSEDCTNCKGLGFINSETKK